MTIESKTTMSHDHTARLRTRDNRTLTVALKAGHFFLHWLEMLLAMGVGMGIFHLLANLIPASSSFAAVNDSETVLHNVFMDIFMTVPMLGWMMLRGHGWRHSLEMGAAMLAPMAVINLLCSLGAVEYLPWLVNASGPAMFLGMLAAMLYRRDHFTMWSFRSSQHAH
jgi:hypothetical protein